MHDQSKQEVTQCSVPTWCGIRAYVLHRYSICLRMHLNSKVEIVHVLNSWSNRVDKILSHNYSNPTKENS